MPCLSSPSRHCCVTAALAALTLLVVFPAAGQTVEADSLFARAGRVLESGDIDSAERLYQEILEIDDDDHRALNGLAMVGVARGDADYAIEYARKAVRKDKKNPDYHMTLAFGYATRLMKGGVSSAFYAGKFKGECETTLKLDPTNLDAHMALLQYYAAAPGLMGGSMEKARKTAATIAELDEYLGHIAGAVLAETDGDMTATETEYLAAAFVDTTDPEGWGRLGMFYMRSGEYEKAIPVGIRASRLVPDDWNAPYQIGKAYLLLGEDLDESERWFLAALGLMDAEGGIDKTWPAAVYWRLGMIDERRGDLEAARVDWERALEIDEVHPMASASLDSLNAVLPQGKTTQPDGR